MRVLVIAGFADSVVPFRGELIRAMLRNGCEVHVAAPALTSAHGVAEALGLPEGSLHDIPLARAGTNPLSDARALFALIRLMRKLRPDASLPYTIKPVIYATLAAWLTGVPRRFALVTGLGYAFTGGRSGVLKAAIEKLYGFALARETKVFFQNPDDAQLLRDLGVLPAQVPAVVVNGSGVDVLTHTESPLPTQAMSFLLIARLLGDKGVREYAAAARAIRQRHPQTRFLLVGWIDENPDSIRKDELDRWVNEGIIEFLGRLPDVRPAIAATTVFVLPSYREGTPRTVLEAMAMGRPIITTDAPGCRETVMHGENGFLVPVRDVDALVEAMQRFLDDPGLATRMGQKSRQIAEDKYDVHKVNAVMLREMGLVQNH